MSTISTHVLDTALGRPADGLELALARQDGSGAFTELSRQSTNDDGRVKQLLPDGDTLTPGVYQMTFETGPYLDRVHGGGFYPVVPIIFKITASDEHYHVPLLLSPYGISTYRGS
ncbi:MAG: 5-hydroxyisourate hydrolase [Myxococcota bacterium]|jgi:5-hydroxyisourate hydrolase